MAGALLAAMMAGAGAARAFYRSPESCHAYRLGFIPFSTYQKLRDAIAGDIGRQNSKVSLPALDLVAQLRKLERKDHSRDLHKKRHTEALLPGASRGQAG